MFINIHRSAPLRAIMKGSHNWEHVYSTLISTCQLVIPPTPRIWKIATDDRVGAESVFVES